MAVQPTGPIKLEKRKLNKLKTNDHICEAWEFVK